MSAEVELLKGLPGGLTAFDLTSIGVEGEARDMEAIVSGLRSATAAVCGEGQGKRVRQVVLSPATRSVVAVGRENALLTPALFVPEGEDLPQPPAALLPEATAAQVRRYASVAAWLCHWMSGEWIGLLGRAPLGLPVVAETGEYDPRREAWQRARATLTWSPLLVPERAVMAQIAPVRAEPLGVPAFTPIVGRLTGRPQEARG